MPVLALPKATIICYFAPVKQKYMSVLPLRTQVGYISGMLGWSILTNNITVMLIYFYVPPSNSNMEVLIPQVTIFGIFTILSLIAASGRLLDAITDPLIAFWSDRLKHPRGRRIPFMLASFLPAAICCILIFFPYKQLEEEANIWWLALTQAGFYLFMTAYIVPYNALLPELAPTHDDKIRLSTLLSLAFVIGIIISSQTPGLAVWLESQFAWMNRHESLQWAIALQVSAGTLFLFIPILAVDERTLLSSRPVTLPFGKAFRQIVTNRNFQIFILADFAYFVSLTIVSSSLLYVLTVLLGLEESLGGAVMGLLVVVSLLFYPTVGGLVKKLGKKPLVVSSLLLQGVLLLCVYFFGRLPLAPETQIFTFAVLAAIPAAYLGILPYAIIANLAERDTDQTGQQKEAMYFAARNFSTKMGQTVGIMIFAILTIFGKDPGNDLGIRLSAIFGGLLCIVAGIVFIGFHEERDSENV